MLRLLIAVVEEGREEAPIFEFRRGEAWEFPGVAASLPAWGTEILQAAQCREKRKGGVRLGECASDGLRYLCSIARDTAFT